MVSSLVQRVLPASASVARAPRRSHLSHPADHFVVYLSGSIRKGDTDDRDPVNFWTDADVAAVADPLRGNKVTFINPATAGIRRSDYWANFGCDLQLVRESNLMVVDARTEKGIGVGGEMMYAHSCGVPIITVAPQNSNYRRDFVPNICGEDLTNWVHPFVFGLSNVIVDSFEEAGELIRSVLEGFDVPEKPSIDDAVNHYLRVSASWG